jgi:mercuric reductase
MDKFDFVIIGSGSAGVMAAVRATAIGARTALVEKGTLGGTCVNIGCVPTKNLLRAGEVVHLAKEKVHGVTGNQYVSLSFTDALDEARRVSMGLRQDQFEAKLAALQNFTRFTGTARFGSPHALEVDGRVIRGEKFLIATGSSPFIPPIDGLEEAGYLTNENFLGLSGPPPSLIVLGGGPLGLEFAQMFAHFGSRVTVVQRGGRILSGVEPEIADAARRWLEDEGIRIRTGAEAKSVTRNGSLNEMTITSDGREERLAADEILLAVGRRPNSAGLGLGEIGLQLDRRGAIVVDDEMRTSLSHIYAAGDVSGEPMLENAAAKEGAVAAENALAEARMPMTYDSIPSCTFIHPEVAQVGLTEVEAANRGHRVEVRLLHFSEVPKARVLADTRGLIKMVVEKETRRVLGCALAADHAGDLIHEAALAIKYQLTAEDLADLVYVYPTLAEATGMVARMFRRSAPGSVERPAA